jgi:hypothetical protein
MATAVPAGLTGDDGRIGAIKSGLFADFLIIRPAGPTADYALVHAGPTDILMVMVGGHPLYGQKDLVESVAPRLLWTPIAVAGTMKGVALPPDSSLGSWPALTAALDKAMRSVGTRLGPPTSE